MTTAITATANDQRRAVSRRYRGTQQSEGCSSGDQHVEQQGGLGLLSKQRVEATILDAEEREDRGKSSKTKRGPFADLSEPVKLKDVFGDFSDGFPSEPCS